MIKNRFKSLMVRGRNACFSKSVSERKVIKKILAELMAYGNEESGCVI